MGKKDLGRGLTEDPRTVTRSFSTLSLASGLSLQSFTETSVHIFVSPGPHQRTGSLDLPKAFGKIFRQCRTTPTVPSDPQPHRPPPRRESSSLYVLNEIRHPHPLTHCSGRVVR